MNFGRAALVAVYLAAIVAANLIITHKGPTWAPYTAFVLIGLDLTCRDRLHSYWERRHLIRNMAVLIAAGSAITIALNTDSTRIAVASFAAFSAAATTDAIVYQWRHHRPWLERSNDSNTAAAAVDSAVFILIYLGSTLGYTSSTLWALVFSLFTAKVAGGYLWSLILRPRKETTNDCLG